VEIGRLEFECERRDGFHLNVNLCAERIVDEAGRDVRAGTSGEDVVSNLVNWATVLLNYWLDDRASLAAGPCPCERLLPLLERLKGPCPETIVLADGSRPLSWWKGSSGTKCGLP
jgi:phenylacetate-CoA ligase